LRSKDSILCALQPLSKSVSLWTNLRRFLSLLSSQSTLILSLANIYYGFYTKNPLIYAAHKLIINQILSRPSFEPGPGGCFTGDDGPCVVLAAAIPEEGVHDVRLVPEDRNHVGNRLHPEQIYSSIDLNNSQKIFCNSLELLIEIQQITLFFVEIKETPFLV